MYFSLEKLEQDGVIQMGRGNVISKDDISAKPGNYPIYSSSAQGNGEFGKYGTYMFDDERVTWSIDGGGKFFYRHPHKYSVTNVCGWIKVLKPNVLNTKYLFYALSYQWMYFVFDYTYKAHPSVIRPKYKVRLLPLQKQQDIVHKLDAISDIIHEKENQIPLYDELVKSRFVELFGNIDECDNKLELQDVCEKITDGSHNPPAGIEKSENYMISSQNIHDNIIEYKDVRYLSDSDFDNENKRTAIMPGDVLLTIVGAIGRSAVVKDNLNITCQRSVCVIHPNRDKVNSIFLTYMLDSISDKIINEARGAAQKGIYLNQVKRLQIICPSFDLQNQFAAFVERTDKSKLAATETLKYLEELKASLMNKYFN